MCIRSSEANASKVRRVGSETFVRKWAVGRVASRLMQAGFEGVQRRRSKEMFDRSRVEGMVTWWYGWTIAERQRPWTDGSWWQFIGREEVDNWSDGGDEAKRIVVYYKVVPNDFLVSLLAPTRCYPNLLFFVCGCGGDFTLWVDSCLQY